MIEIEQLRYVRLGTVDLDGAVDFATRVLGLQLVDRDADHAWFRSDDRDHTLCYERGAPGDQTLGIEVRDEDALARAADDLRAAGFDVTTGDASSSAIRRVREHVTVTPPGGPAIDLVVRPLHSGWRYFPSRDAGVRGFHGVALRCPDITAALRFWTRTLSGRVSDYVGDAVYVRTDTAHHRVALYPSAGRGLLEVQFVVEGIDQLMQNAYWLQSAQVPIVHGPGRRPASGQAFLSLRGPDGMLFGLVTEANRITAPDHLPRQFRHARNSFCAWGSHTEIPEWHTSE